MRQEDDRQLGNSVRKRAGDEENAVMRAQWEILAGTYVSQLTNRPRGVMAEKEDR